MGYNGAGKSTLIKLLMRLYDPTEGEILLNGINIKEYNLKAYRSLFAAAFQDGKIFARSIRDNLVMGREKGQDTDPEPLWNALSRSGIDSVVKKLPKGMDTVLTREFDPQGAVLSGGQVQKLVAARAFFQDTPIRIFDEPSSALDPISEHDLMESIKKDAQGRILLLISHRLSCVQDMEKIIVLKDGRIMQASWRRRGNTPPFTRCRPGSIKRKRPLRTLIFRKKEEFLYEKNIIRPLVALSLLP